MTQISRPWVSTTPGDAGPYSADNWASLQRYIMQDGQNGDSGPVEGSGTAPDNGLSVTQRGAGANMSVDISAGAAMVNGTFYLNDATVNLVIAANASGNPRIDTIVLNKDWSAQTVRLVVSQGTPAGSPVPPAMIQSAGTQWQIPLADIAVANGAISITNANITPRGVPANGPSCVCLRGILNNSGAVLQTGDVVVWDTTADRAVTTTTTAANNLVAGVWIGRTAIGGYGRMMQHGMMVVNVNGALATRGIGLITHTVAKQAASAGAITTTTNSQLRLLGFNLQTSGGSGLVLCFVNVLTAQMMGSGQTIKRDNGATYSSSSTVYVAVDTTNLSVTINVYSGKVIIAFSGVENPAAGSTIIAEWDVDIDGTRVGSAGTDGIFMGFSSGGGASGVSFTVVATGLTPGAHTFKLFWRTKNGSAGTITLASGNGTGGQDFIPVFSVAEIP